MTKALVAVRANTEILAIVSAVVLGFGLVFAAGFSHSATAHDIAHDSRHAIGFPCH
ncbi:CbtB domain-containing protein [Marivivens sp. LCG002]|uniref:CbtB domain-containing protein n=1 Tax=Marivivens sp. LCG002 TaxID=3051171 RepID=UPI00255733CE|nr:CbtB domain-containing protein [Marivivens sp. LCG002]WIV50997.1 CbtB domain-containing protein [Marivivens sp. LCG002]